MTIFVIRSDTPLKNKINNTPEMYLQLSKFFKRDENSLGFSFNEKERINKDSLNKKIATSTS